MSTTPAPYDMVQWLNAYDPTILHSGIALPLDAARSYDDNGAHEAAGEVPVRIVGSHQGDAPAVVPTVTEYPSKAVLPDLLGTVVWHSPDALTVFPTR